MVTVRVTGSAAGTGYSPILFTHNYTQEYGAPEGSCEIHILLRSLEILLRSLAIILRSLEILFRSLEIYLLRSLAILLCSFEILSKY